MVSRSETADSDHAGRTGLLCGQGYCKAQPKASSAPQAVDRVLLDQRIDTRQFDGWAMTYASRYEFADELEAILGQHTVSASDVEHLMQRLFFAPA